MSSREPDVWQMIFEQTPEILRWVMGFLTLGIFTLASVIYKWHREDMRKVREEQRKDMDQTRENVNRIHTRIDELHREMSDNHNALYQLLLHRRKGD